MENRYDILKQIIDQFEKYESENQRVTLSDFSRWLSVRVKQQPEEPETIITEFKALRAGKSSYSKNPDEGTRFLEYISRISKYHEFYIRKSLTDTPLNSRLEFLFLQTVNQLERAKKTDLLGLHLVEYSTCMDTIKRLVNNNLLLEVQDDNDKRVKLLKITEQGKSVLKNAEIRIVNEKMMFLACISPNKWRKTLPVLQEMDEFHNSVYLKHNNKPFAELLNLMDSLKYLHQ
jgi:DNA-binding MarR family transcriptional regulator